MEAKTDSKSPDHLPWIEKYRPNSLDELIAHEEITQILNRLIESNKLPHLLFYGPPGTGKTSTIIACAKKMYGERYNSMTLELNASDDRGIDVVRLQIKEFAGTKNMYSSGVKLVILDEADAMTTDAQSALRRVIEKYTSNTRFCLICNYVNKIMPALQSRCTKFRFSPLQPSQVMGRLNYVIEREGISMTEGGRDALLALSGGDLRRVLNLLQSAHMSHSFRGEEEVEGGGVGMQVDPTSGRSVIDESAVYLTAGAVVPSVGREICLSLLNDDLSTAHQTLTRCMDDFGFALCDIVTEISRVVLIGLALPDPVLALLSQRLSDIEMRLHRGASEKIQAGALVGCFILARNMISSS